MISLLFSIILCFSFAQAELVEKIVAIVNDEIITLSDIKKYEARLKSGLTLDELIAQGASNKELLADRNKLINLLIDERIIDSEVKKQNLSVTIERVEKEIRNISKGNNISRAQLKQTLQSQGVDFSEYQNMIKTRLERQSLIEKNLSSNIKITDDEAKDFVGKQGSPNEVAEYTISHILFKTSKGLTVAQKRAAAVLEKIKSGKSFEELANDNSEDPNFTKGGLLGTFRQDEMLREFEKEVKKMAVNSVSGPVKTKLGIHILKLVDKKTISNPVAEKEIEKARAILSQRAFQRQFRIWLDQRRQEAFIKTNRA